MRLVVAIMVGIVSASLIYGQNGPKFEVASIRPCKEGDGGAARSPNGNPTPGSVRLPCTTLKNLIQSAYRDPRKYAHTVTLVPIDGGPGWMNSDRYTIIAKAEGNPSAETLYGPMLQALLEDRFQLKMRRETREIPVYALTIAKNGPKLQPFQEGSCIGITPGPPEPGQKPFCGVTRTRRNGETVTVEMFGVSVDEFATSLGVNAGPRLLDRPVIDRTGIAGVFSFTFTFAPEATDPDPLGPSIFTAIQEQLGLRLESSRGSGEFLVVDRLARPSEN
jgi:uncharacterized protein (TIGR03435 family)